MHNVRVFSAEATATLEVNGPYKPDDRHAMLIFCRQAVGEDHAWPLAEAGAHEAGWRNISVERAGTLAPENLNGQDEQFRNAFESALQGSADPLCIWNL
jgi:hypothetical protein